jgi:hypothetical protein
MIERRQLLKGSAALVAAAVAAPALAGAPSVSDTLNELGPEGHALARQAGVWDVIETVWATPDAAPQVSQGVAVRRMIGSLLQEFLRPAGGSSDAAISRIDYLSFNRLEGRWNYVSMDTRAPVGIMTANSFERDPPERIQVVFNPFAIPDSGPAALGRLLRMDELIETQGVDASRKDQHFILAEATPRKWLAHRFAYTRRGRS